jgi:hypothetical protein
MIMIELYLCFYTFWLIELNRPNAQTIMSWREQVIAGVANLAGC